MRTNVILCTAVTNVENRHIYLTCYKKLVTSHNIIIGSIYHSYRLRRHQLPYPYLNRED